MLTVAAALAPVLALIALGYALRRAGFPGEGFWRPAARAVYFVFLPALLVRIIAEAPLAAGVWRLQAIAVLTVSVLTVLLALARKPVCGDDGPAFTSVVQGGVRHNTYLGLAVAAPLFTEAQVAAFALIAAAVVPVVNAVAVVALARFGRRGADYDQEAAQPRGLRQTLRLVALNPLILACAAGFLLNATGVGLPGFAAASVDLLSRPALPLGLLTVGAGLRAGALARPGVPALAASACRLVAYPLFAYVLAEAWGIDGPQLAPLMLFAALPTAASSYALALELGGDAELMARVITLETLAAALTIPAVLALVGA